MGASNVPRPDEPAAERLFAGVLADTVTLLIDVGGRVTAWNAAAAGMLGLAPADDITAAGVLPYLAPECRGSVEQALAQALAGAEVSGLSVQLLLRDGRRVVAAATLTPLMVGGQVAQVLFVAGPQGDEPGLVREVAAYRALFVANPRPMWVYDTETLRFLEVNDAATEVYGYSREEFLAMTLAGIRPPEELPALRAAMAENSALRMASARARHRTRAGHVIDVAVFGHQLMYGGRAARLVAVEDITERLAVEQALRESEERYRRTFAEAGIGIARLAPDGRLQDVNEQVVRILGRTREELAGHHLREFTFPLDVGLLTERLTTLLSGDPPVVSFPMRCLNRRGEAVWIDATLSRVAGAGGEPTFVVAMLQDVTERRRAELALAESERRYRTLMEDATDAILVFHDDGRIIDANAAAGVLLGLPRTKLLNMRTSALDVQGEEGAAVRVALRSGAEYRGEVELGRRDGNRTPVELLITRIVDGRFLLTARDMTPQLAARRQHEQMREQEAEAAAAREADRFKTDLINVVSHELRTPLAAIKGYASALLQFAGDVEVEEQREFVTEIDRAADRLSRLVEDLLLAGRAASGTLSVRSEPVALASILRETAAQVRQVTGRAITVKVPARLPVVAGDQLRLSQVAGNLLSNAVKFSPEGGDVRLEAAPGTGPAGQPGVRFRVADQGIGIDPEDLPHVFDRFFRAASAQDRRIGGTGLGLPICQEIVRAHHGQLTIDSAPGAGTAVTVWLPAMPERGRRRRSGGS